MPKPATINGRRNGHKKLSGTQVQFRHQKQKARWMEEMIERGRLQAYKELGMKPPVNGKPKSGKEDRKPVVSAVKRDGSLRTVPGGRGSLLTRKFQDALVSKLKLGMPFTYACAAAGVMDYVVMDWMRRGAFEIEQGLDTEPYALFYKAVKAARGVAVERKLAAIDAGAKNWQGRAWILERCFPREFAAISRLELSGRDGGPLQHEQAPLDLRKLSDEELTQLEAIVRKAGADRKKALPAAGAADVGEL